MTNYIEKRSNNSFLLRVKIKPNSRKQEIIKDEDRLIIRVRSKALKNKANKELLGFLRKKLGVPSDHLMILSGLKSSNKTIEIVFNENSDESRLKKLLT
jgi:uncharacterized protein (TIGR00251 family)